MITNVCNSSSHCDFQLNNSQILSLKKDKLKAEWKKWERANKLKLEDLSLDGDV